LRPRLTTGLPFSPWHSGLGGLSVFPAQKLDRTCVYESEGKIQVVQLRRILLLFALVLGLSALAASLAPPPDDTPERAEEPFMDAAPSPEHPPRRLRLSVPTGNDTPPTRRAAPGTRVALEVAVSRAGEVAIDDLGLRQSADPRTPARFEFLATGARPVAVVFHPVRGRARLAGRLEFRPRERSR
jgi:hypothetical protein